MTKTVEVEAKEIVRKYFQKEGFSEEEINSLLKNGWIDIGKNPENHVVIVLHEEIKDTPIEMAWFEKRLGEFLQDVGLKVSEAYETGDYFQIIL